MICPYHLPRIGAATAEVLSVQVYSNTRRSAHVLVYPNSKALSGTQPLTKSHRLLIGFGRIPKLVPGKSGGRDTSSPGGYATECAIEFV